jgi:hypothetical protein
MLMKLHSVVSMHGSNLPNPNKLMLLNSNA